MLSITLPTISEKITLNGVEVEVYPLPLFFIENVQRAYPRPDKDTDPTGYAVWLRQWVAVRTIEALGLSSEIALEVEVGHRIDGTPTVERLIGRPGWDDSAMWPAYAMACADALEASGFSTAHVNAISDAVGRLDKRQLEALEPAGNS